MLYEVITVGSLVNVERAAHYGAEVGGHVLSGPIDAAAANPWRNDGEPPWPKPSANTTSYNFV